MSLWALCLDHLAIRLTAVVQVLPSILEIEDYDSNSDLQIPVTMLVAKAMPRPVFHSLSQQYSD
jgi:hypothetical protein